MQEYEYHYEGAEFYCYPKTQILINKLGIHNEKKLSEIEQAITFPKWVAYKNNPIKGNFDFNHFCQIHHYLFAELYEWAGKPRLGGFMSIGRTKFIDSEYIKSSFDDIYEKLQKDNFFKNLPKEEFCEKMAYFMADINKVHPFRDGNGRTMKLYFSQLAQNSGYDLEFSLASKDDLILADVLAYNGNYQLLIEILNKIVSSTSTRL